MTTSLHLTLAQCLHRRQIRRNFSRCPDVRSWGDIRGTNLKQAASACLALSAGAAPSVALTSEVAGQGSDVSKPIQTTPVDTYLSRLQASPNSIEAVATEISENEAFAPIQDDRTESLESALLEYAKPLAASKAEANCRVPHDCAVI